MSKKLNEDVIKNELQGQSGFFKRPVQRYQRPPERRLPVEDTSDKVKPAIVDTVIPRNHDTIEEIRKAVKETGKEAATHRFSKEEKDLTADIVYTFGRQGIKTSENQISRIGLHWLIKDYKENGEQSILFKVLKALKE